MRHVEENKKPDRDKRTPTKSNLRAVLFDYGMVLSTPAVPSAHQELIDLFGIDAGPFDRHYWANRHDYDAGRFHGESYWKKVASDVGTTLTSTQITRLIEADILMWSGINIPVLEWARSVARAGLRTGILSNICFELVASLEKRFCWVQEFPYSTWSCRAGVAKPDPAIYECAVKKLEVRAEEILFIDDRAENISAAEAAGLTGIVFQDLSRLRLDLQERGFAEFLPDIVAQEQNKSLRMYPRIVAG